ncbi:hypothetical protein ACOSP7_022021 [Xanthoceras sorbifolium]
MVGGREDVRDFGIGSEAGVHATVLHGSDIDPSGKGAALTSVIEADGIMHGAPSRSVAHRMEKAPSVEVMFPPSSSNFSNVSTMHEEAGSEAQVVAGDGELVSGSHGVLNSIRASSVKVAAVKGLGSSSSHRVEGSSEVGVGAASGSSSCLLWG